MTPKLPAAPGLLAVLAAPADSVLQRIPAEAPISGVLWTVVVPTLLFAVSLGATWALFRHYSRRQP